jgi:hypothetical protein
VGGGATEGLFQAGKDILPSTQRASAALSDVKSVAGSIPIDMSKPGNTALELYTQSQRGATLPKVVRDFVNRATKPGADPITCEEAKDFQSNISNLSADEKMSLKPNTKRLVGQLNTIPWWWSANIPDESRATIDQAPSTTNWNITVP